ncbi:MAG: phytoene/squalene synthase family protein [Bacteroidia bacterium]
MMELYHATCQACSKLITNRYSTSFSLGIKTLSKKYHAAIYGIYGFVRYADEIVDTFHDYDKKVLLDNFRADTYRGIEQGISLNPVIHAFQQAVNTYNIEQELIDAFLHSMEMDLDQSKHSDATYDEYIYGSAEVIGLMCLRVFCKGDEDEYQRLKPTARRLGSAFQKVNFLRDLKSDFQERGRVYFPGVNFSTFDNEAKALIEADIEEDFNVALQGIRELPSGARKGVYLAYVYYRKLFEKIRQAPATQVQQARIRIPDGRKLTLLVQTYFKHQLNAI